MSPAQWAAQAMEAVRWLNHATINLGRDPAEGDGLGGYVSPGDVDDTLAHLQVLVDRLPQALGQMSRWLDRQARAGLVRHDACPVQLSREESVRQGQAAVLVLADHLDAACARLGAVAADLTRARRESSHLAAFTDDLDDEGPDHEDVDDEVLAVEDQALDEGRGGGVR
jgi:hypothetical protein